MKAKKQNVFDAIKNGDQKTFEELYKEFFPQLVMFARKYIGRLEDAEEIVQQLFSNLWFKRKDLTINQSVKAYLFNSVRNNCFDFLKHEKVKNQYAGYAINEMQVKINEEKNEFIIEETINKVYNAIELLPEKSKKIFKMNRFEGLKYREIAEELGVSPKTVENQMGIALKKLRISLSDYYTEKKSKQK